MPGCSNFILKQQGKKTGKAFSSALEKIKDLRDQNHWLTSALLL